MARTTRCSASTTFAPTGEGLAGNAGRSYASSVEASLQAASLYAAITCCLTRPPACLPALPRRGAPLSEGWVNTKGGHSCVVCPYHGWAFDGTGSLQDVPVSPHLLR